MLVLSQGTAYNVTELPGLDPSTSNRDSGESEGAYPYLLLNILISRKYQNNNKWTYLSSFVP